ncbi:TIGR02678 family protein [Oceanobacillus locisalsi]|uniref:TIGR02678 family protein n=1 Tax=Oceanobacillus locisalsi TaxID=546107 RepID=A0ABW3NB46_9BACI
MQDTGQKQVKEEVQYAIRQLLERFWITRADDEELYFLIEDNEMDIKSFFRDTFRYRLIITHELAKLEKIPVKTYNWMGNKEVKGQYSFKQQRDFVFFFCLLAFIEGKGRDDQFSLQNICEAIQAYYPQSEAREPVIITWKEGSGYKNRLSLIRVVKYALKMKLMIEVDQSIEDFAGDGEHDVLFERTPYVSQFLRPFKDIYALENYDDFKASLAELNAAHVDGKHRFYRRLFLEPVVYHGELSEEEQEYVKRYYPAIENNISKFTGYEFERYKQSYLLVKTKMVMGEAVHPAENMLSNLVVRFAGYLLEHQQDYTFSFTNTVELSNHEIERIAALLKERDGKQWSKSFKEMSSEQLRIQVTDYLLNWNFADRLDDKTIRIKEGIFRVVGTYTEASKEESKA